ncbi:hypothetical protein J7E97_27605 [Streptomyces sp. ISL-66]|uniref:DUF6479 family protein n=1 Tax=Streptomyces sp. ISL-66 TaxID=2819186 RepID=UPI001BECF4EC|nr:DUF6479 family protein [Streptomyces sp. ISL-66]MBT2471528.1 hypothetical protein [Streptomyces sp. ISL-66]
MPNFFVLLVIGVLITALLIGAVWWGIKRRTSSRTGRETATPGRRAARPDAGGADFPDDGSRRTAHEMKGYGNIGTRGTEDDDPG